MSLAVEKIIMSHLELEDELKAEIAKIEDKKKQSKVSATKTLVSFFKENPDAHVNAADIASGINQDAALAVITTVNKMRTFTLEELNDNFLCVIVRGTYRRKYQGDKAFNLAEEVFVKLDTDEKKIKFCLHGNGTTNAASESSSAKAYLNKHFGIPMERYGKTEEPTRLYRSGFHNDLQQIGFQLSLTQGNYDGIEDTADKIIKLLNSGSKVRGIDVFEHTLSQYTSYYLMLIDDNDELEPTFCEGRFHEKTFEGNDKREKLVNALKYIADNHWYESASKSDCD
ncbi:hypothetical protein [Vibrio crassostreae]|uniref:hypothetical protein n=1 Tax=Vibrio crassostreae TaxID=246167 RepID=UPI001B3080B7|nr:hypothetical protein [Vibrio crassostreae]